MLPLGLVELGREARVDDTANSWHAVRLTALGFTLLGDATEKAARETTAGKVVVQPNFQIVAIGPLGLDVLARLDLFAEREQAERGAVQYRLSRQSVYQAQQWGMEAEAIVAFLEELSGITLPQNVRRSLNEWAGQYNRIVFRSGATVLQTMCGEALDMLMADASVGRLLSRRVTGDIALVPANQVAELIARLLGMGVLPAVGGADPESADESVVIDQDGSIESVFTMPSLHLRGRLMKVAEERGDGRWQLTPASVRGFGGSREKVQQLLDDLSRLQRGELPEAVIERIKTWGGYYGKATTGTVTLVEFSDPQCLAELWTHRKLKGLLTPFSAGDRALAVVPADRLVEVQEILGDLGVDVSETLSR